MSYEISNDLFFGTTPPGANGGAPASATEYQEAECGPRVLSPIPQQDWIQIGNKPPGALPNDRWVKTPGEDIYVPDFKSGDLKRPANWPMDPVAGFTQEKMLQFQNLYGGIVIPPSFNPLNQEATLSEIAGISNARASASLIGDEVAQTPISDPSAVLRPADFDDEPISALDARTTVVEFTVPASPFQERGLKAVVANFMKQVIAKQLMAAGQAPQPALLSAGAHMLQKCPCLVTAVGVDPTYNLPIVEPAAPATSYKLRGWFIKGEGKAADQRPLIIFTLGRTGSICGLNEKCRQYRKMVSHLAGQGYDVLFYDPEGHGISEGWNRYRNFSPPSRNSRLYAPGQDASRPLTWLPVPNATITDPRETGNAVNIFLLIDQLIEKGLIQGANTTRVILYGVSQGAAISAKAMQLRFAPPPGLAGDYSGYDLRGIIDSDSDGGSLMFLCDSGGFPPAYYMVEEAVRRSIFGSTWFSDGAVHESVAAWGAGYLGLKAVYDYFSPEGTVALFNRARGHKRITMVKGWHAWGLLAGVNFEHVARDVDEFCRHILISQSAAMSNDSATRTLDQELCKAPDFDITTFQ